MTEPKVTVRRLYEVECDICGVIDSQRRRPDAEEARTLHLMHAHSVSLQEARGTYEGNASTRGGVKVKATPTSIEEV